MFSGIFCRIAAILLLLVAGNQLSLASARPALVPSQRRHQVGQGAIRHLLSSTALGRVVQSFPGFAFVNRNEEDQDGVRECKEGCEGGEECVNETLNECKEDSFMCICFDTDTIKEQDKDCKKQSDCSGGRRCVRISNLKRDFCIPPEVAEYFGFLDVEKADKVCIDVKALSALKREELVYEEHPVASVLCDSNESCATPGHMVSYRGKGMMMKTYCAIAGCEKRVIQVNSPSYRVGMRIESNTKGLEYTALAARYETAIEESAMSTAIRFGF